MTMRLSARAVLVKFPLGGQSFDWLAVFELRRPTIDVILHLRHFLCAHLPKFLQQFLRISVKLLSPDATF